MTTFKELYQKGNKYRCNDVNCEVIDVRYSKTGRISAKVKNKEWGEFWTTSINPEKTIDCLHSNRASVSQDFTIQTK